MTDHQQATLIAAEAGTQTIKCVVWDLDNTLWDGILLEDGVVTPRPAIVDVIKTLDSRGILSSVASRNDHAAAMQTLTALGIAEYLLYPQINWSSKAESIKQIAKLLNIGIDTLAFVDDQPFERDEVAFVLPTVLTIDASDAETIPDMERMKPRFITEDSRLRRQMYQSDIARQMDESRFVGSNEQFLATLGMVFTLAEAQEDDLQRAEELTVRTHQLNTTGYTYSYDELNALRRSSDHRLLVATLEDRYGSYGKIGLALLACGSQVWTIKLLLMSCRVMSRGVGTIMINQIMRDARNAGARLHAEFIATERNRMMYITYKFAGFTELRREGNLIIVENDRLPVPDVPPYVVVKQRAGHVHS